MSGLLSKLRNRKNKAQPTCAAVIPAAGAASRMAGIDKVLEPIGEIPILIHTLNCFNICGKIREIVVVTREDLLVPISQLCKQWQLDKVSKVIVGGEVRTQSVLAGVREACQDTDLIAIHDGARPFLSQQLLKATIERAAQTGAAAPAVSILDTVKRASNGLVTETLDRSQLYAVQTPQIFDATLIRGALEQAVKDGVVLTDDCAAVERLGMRVSLVEGERENIKITVPVDLILGNAILELKGE